MIWAREGEISRVMGFFHMKPAVHDYEFVLLLDARPNSGQYESRQRVCFCGIMSGDALAMSYAEVGQPDWVSSAH